MHSTQYRSEHPSFPLHPSRVHLISSSFNKSNNLQSSPHSIILVISSNSWLSNAPHAPQGGRDICAITALIDACWRPGHWHNDSLTLPLAQNVYNNKFSALHKLLYPNCSQHRARSNSRCIHTVLQCGCIEWWIFFDNQLLNALNRFYSVQACDFVFGPSVFDLCLDLQKVENKKILD